MKLLLTGRPGVGKSTLISSLLQKVKNKQGFITQEIRENGYRVGFKLISVNEIEKTLAHVDFQTPYKVSRYSVDVKTLDSFVDPLFNFDSSQLLYLDEIGRMELFSNKFKKLVEVYLAASNNFLGTLTSVYNDEFTEKIKARNEIIFINLTPENRDELRTVCTSMIEALDNFQKLTEFQQKAITTLARGYFKQNQFIQLNKLFKNALIYLVKNKVQVLGENEFKVSGNTGNHRVIKINNNWTCDCDLFNGRGVFVGKSGECSHTQVAKVLSNSRTQ